MTAALVTLLFIFLWVVASVAMVALPTLAMTRRLTGTTKAARATSASPSPRVRSEEHDIDDMLDAINERRRRAGRRDIGEELADELMRSTWGDQV
jgi:hypothetical protein